LARRTGVNVESE